MGIGLHSVPSRRGVDGPPDPALYELASRSHRGTDLRAGMAARDRQFLPLPWWLVEIVHRLVGHEFAYYLLAGAAIVAALSLIWVTARPLVGPVGAVVAVLIIDGLHYINYTSAKFNHDVVQLPFWALAGFAFHRALRGGWIGHWLLLASQSECRSGRNTLW